jgi:O-antigen/teichoic acid export membrane protein
VARTGDWGLSVGLLEGILKNTAFLTTGRLFSKLLTGVFMVILARSVGPGGFGKLEFAGSLIALFMMLPEFGFDRLMVREVAKAKDRAAEFVANVLGLKILLVIAAFAILAPFAILQYDLETVEIIAILFLSAFVRSVFLTLCSTFRAFENMKLEALLIIINTSVRFLFGMIAIAMGLGLVGIVLALLSADILALVGGIYVTHRHLIKLRLAFTYRKIRRIALTAIPFGVLTLVEVVLINTDNLMIAKLESETAVGWYSASYKILVMLFLLPLVFMDAIFPVLSRLSASAMDSLRQAYSKAFSYLMMLSFPIAVGGFLLSDQIILSLYGDQFQNSVAIFQIMILVTAFSFVGFINGATLNATGREKIFAVLQGIAALLNVVLDYILIKKFGYIGACYATLVITVTDCIVYSWMCHHWLVTRPDWLFLGKSLLASMGMGGVVLLLKGVSLGVFVTIPVGIVVFFALILLLRTVPSEDMTAIRELSRRKLTLRPSAVTAPTPPE